MALPVERKEPRGTWQSCQRLAISTASAVTARPPRRRAAGRTASTLAAGTHPARSAPGTQAGAASTLGNKPPDGHSHRAVSQRSVGPNRTRRHTSMRAHPSQEALVRKRVLACAWERDCTSTCALTHMHYRTKSRAILHTDSGSRACSAMHTHMRTRARAFTPPDKESFAAAIQISLGASRIPRNRYTSTILLCNTLETFY